MRRAALAVTAFLLAPAAAADQVRIVGSTTVASVVTEAAEILRAEEGLTLVVDVQGGSSGGLAALGQGRADLALSSRPVTESDHQRFPGTSFHPMAIGHDAIAMVVSRDIWEAGVRSLSREEIQGIYERRIRSWRELGGPDRRIAFFNKEPGRGTWEAFADWLYGDASEAPRARFPEVGANAEARSKVAGTRGALSPLSAAWADGERVFTLELRDGDGGVVAPTADNAANGRYPLVRPLLVVTDGPPAGAAARLVEFLLSPRGQVLVTKHGYLPLEPEPDVGTESR